MRTSLLDHANASSLVTITVSSGLCRMNPNIVPFQSGKVLRPGIVNLARITTQEWSSKGFVSASLGHVVPEVEEPQLPAADDNLQLDFSVFEETFVSVRRAEKPVGARVRGLPRPQSTLVPDDWRGAKEYVQRSRKARKEALTLQLNSAEKKVLQERTTLAEIENEQRFLRGEDFMSEDVAGDKSLGDGVEDPNPCVETAKHVYGRAKPKDYRIGLKLMSVDDIVRSLREEEAEARKLEAEYDRKMKSESVAVKDEKITLTAEEKAMLKDRNLDFTVISSGKWSPLHTLAASGQIYLATRLLNRDVPINSVDNDGLTPLHRAVQSCQKHTIRLLIKAGADVHVVDENGATLLHYSAQIGNSEISKLLLRHGVDVNVADKDGWTPLHVAVQSGRFDLIKSLVYRGADVSLANKGGHTPMDLALAFSGCFNFFNAIKFLKQHTAHASSTN